MPTVTPAVTVRAPAHPAAETVLTRDALAFVARLAAEFRGRVDELLAGRRERQAQFDRGVRPAFLAETAAVRESPWRVAPIPADLLDRRVEITGPVDRKMIINALNSGANVFMADFEDSNCPTWDNVLAGQLNLREAVRGSIRHRDAASGKTYALADRTATLMVRPRGWHLPERHVELDGRPIPAALLDFGLFLFHNAQVLIDGGTAPYFYLPKLESHREARLWNDVFLLAQDALRVRRGTIRATVLIETLPAAFEMDEILFELREHSAGLNCGRWDYIFSFIKTFRNHAEFVLPDRAQVTMEQPFMRAYTQLLIKTCHRRGIHAMGGMAAQIPIKHDLELNRIALERVRADKLREVGDGHDGTWVAHPGLVPIAREVFDAHMAAPNQLERRRDDVQVNAADLIQVPRGTRTEAGLRHNVRVGIQYLDAWLRGNGCVPLYHLMEDAATAEISRTQLWQWRKHAAALADGQSVTSELLRAVLAEPIDPPCAAAARELFARLVLNDDCADFLTSSAYRILSQ
ncbi:MAG: malate synthase A [Planctomycetota bacterium]